MENKDAQQKINQLQMYEQSIQNILLQKQQFQSQVLEIDSALKEMGKTSQTYKIIGNIMVASDKEELKEDLESKRSTAELRVKTLEKQEEGIREKFQSLQKEVLKEMEGR